ncbi:type II toxin-antitoxin system HipA family toxin [Nocardioides zhouii]|uniref:Type II toxin-antitoxin system HipA family toxin n=1 Tax=Nocardioides zhouii TaxID=1168729 RepID=A0A4Q2T894_9ACTN|nr:HipA domain-containing protein [Nocardioides zhouii]RYC13294.1 type II toxin-antitoxin system HipA family toxin [Nocardioides zhouii]
MASRSPELEVWLHGRHLATLRERAAFRYHLGFTEEALDEYGEGARILSLAIPVSRSPVEDHRTDPTTRPVSAFLEGLLPEGNLRAQIATVARVAATDKMALLRQVGAECAGAVQFLPAGQAPTAGHVRPLDQTEVDAIVEDLPIYHLPHGAAVQASLAGIQDKVLLTALSDGGWGWPEDGAASTHLIKPQPASGNVLDRLIEAEDWAMRVAAAAGLDAARTRLTTFGERPAIVVTRYDRTAEGHRRHQEDFCQALGLDPQAKYESPAERETYGAARLRRLTSLAAVRSTDPDAFRRQLLSFVTFNAVIGNGDAHSKNYSLLLGTQGEVTLAPLYDAAPVMFLAARFQNTGQLINGRTRIPAVSVADLAAEGASWGMSASRAASTVRSVIDSTWDAVHATPLPAGIERVLPQLENLWATRSWRVNEQATRRA